MKLLANRSTHSGARGWLALAVSLGVAAAPEGCSSGSTSTGSDPTDQGNGSQTGQNASSNGASSGSGASSSSPNSSSSSSPGSSGSESSSSGSGTGDDGTGGDASPPGVGVDGGPATEPDGAPVPPAACMKGQYTAQEVVMIGDSYLDANYGNVGANIVADSQMAGVLSAGAKYREYYLAGAAMNNGAFTLNIPYQYDTSAKGDIAVPNPKDIKLVIMDGGGNDVLIDQQSCLTDANLAAQMADMPCMNAVTNTVARTKKLWQEMATDGVKQIVYFFYPHLDPGGGGLLPTPSPGVNSIDDYSAPLYQQICCGSSFTPTTTAYSCTGNAPGTQCTFVDTRPAFTGHSGALGEPGPDWILSDHVHPNAMGSTTIANLVWDTMVAKCIGQ